jgi:hypothetical protein
VTEVNTKQILTIILAGLLVALMISGAPVKAEDETDVDAEVEVLPAGGANYAAKVIGLRSTILPRLALGEPDGWSAFVFRNGWILLELESSVSDVGTISIWAANRGWHFSNMRIYVSADGKKWKPVGNEKVESADFLKYDFTGSFGSVKYIRVYRNGWPWSWLRLDAVGAKGGE